MFRKYFNAIFKHVEKPEHLRALYDMGVCVEKICLTRSKGLISRVLQHDAAIIVCNVINRICDRYGTNHIGPDKPTRAQVADFVGEYVFSVYQIGRGRDIETVQKQMGIIYGDRLKLDTAFEIARQDHRPADEAYTSVELDELPDEDEMEL